MPDSGTDALHSGGRAASDDAVAAFQCLSLDTRESAHADTAAPPNRATPSSSAAPSPATADREESASESASTSSTATTPTGEHPQPLEDGVSGTACAPHRPAQTNSSPTPSNVPMPVTGNPASSPASLAPGMGTGIRSTRCTRAATQDNPARSPAVSGASTPTRPVAASGIRLPGAAPGKTLPGAPPGTTPTVPGLRGMPRPNVPAGDRSRGLGGPVIPPSLRDKLGQQVSSSRPHPASVDSTPLRSTRPPPLPRMPQAGMPAGLPAATVGGVGAVRPMRPAGPHMNAPRLNFPGGPRPPAGGTGGGLMGRRGGGKLTLGALGSGPAKNTAGPGAPGNGRLAGVSEGGKMSTLFDDYSNIVDTDGRLKFADKAVLSAHGVEFDNGTTFKIQLEDLELLDELGRGNYGTVRKVRHTKTNVLMAMKEIRLELDDPKLKAIIMELDILHRAVAPQIVEFYGAFFVEGCVFYCMEYMDAGSMDKLSIPGRHIPEPVLARIAWSMVTGLRFLKDSLNIIHRDVKPTNVLVNTKGQIKLCDFGVSGELEKSLAKTSIGCQSYMAPERINPQHQASGLPGAGTYTVASDVWSLGLSIVEIAKGGYPYPPDTYTDVFAQLQAIVWGDPPTLPAANEDGTGGYSPEANDFVHQCLAKNPDQRASYATLLAHPFLLADRARAESDDDIDMAAWVKNTLKAKDQAKAQSTSPAPEPRDSSP